MKRSALTRVILHILIFLAFGGSGNNAYSEDGRLKKKATVTFKVGDKKSILKLYQRSESGGVTIKGKLEISLKEGKHGLHIHEVGVDGEGPACDHAKGHFNPFHKNHGGPEDADRHLGDLGNIETVASGATFVQIEDVLMTFSGNNSIVGRSLVIHDGEDDLGKGSYFDSKKTGHSGQRITCGIIVAFSSAISISFCVKYDAQISFLLSSVALRLILK